MPHTGSGLSCVLYREKKNPKTHIAIVASILATQSRPERPCYSAPYICTSVCGRVECTEWSDEDTALINICRNRDGNCCNSVMVHILSLFWHNVSAVYLSFQRFSDCACIKKAICLSFLPTKLSPSSKRFHFILPLSPNGTQYQENCCTNDVTQFFCNKTS